MAYNLFQHPTSLGMRRLINLTFECDPFMPPLFKLLLPTLRYMDDEKCRINLDAM